MTGEMDVCRHGKSYDGPATIQMSFQLLGQVAASELFADPAVGESMKGLAKYVDENSRLHSSHPRRRSRLSRNPDRRRPDLGGLKLGFRALKWRNAGDFRLADPGVLAHPGHLLVRVQLCGRAQPRQSLDLVA